MTWYQDVLVAVIVLGLFGLVAWLAYLDMR